MRWRDVTLPEHGGRGPALPGPQRACFLAARAARAASGSDGVLTFDRQCGGVMWRCQSMAAGAQLYLAPNVRVF